MIWAKVLNIPMLVSIEVTEKPQRKLTTKF